MSKHVGPSSRKTTVCTGLENSELAFAGEDMRALLCKQWGPPSSLSMEEELPTPRPSTGQVLIAVFACGVNYPDLLVIQVRYFVESTKPVLGISCMQ